jgi:hypothetical protein
VPTEDGDTIQSPKFLVLNKRQIYIKNDYQRYFTLIQLHISVAAAAQQA